MKLKSLVNEIVKIHFVFVAVTTVILNVVIFVTRKVFCQDESVEPELTIVVTCHFKGLPEV